MWRCWFDRLRLKVNFRIRFWIIWMRKLLEVSSHSFEAWIQPLTLSFLGTVASIKEAVDWLRYTYFFIRARLNPLAYGIKNQDAKLDPELEQYLTDFCVSTARKLDANKMIRFDPMSVCCCYYSFNNKTISETNIYRRRTSDELHRISTSTLTPSKHSTMRTELWNSHN